MLPLRGRVMASDVVDGVTQAKLRLADQERWIPVPAGAIWTIGDLISADQVGPVQRLPFAEQGAYPAPHHETYRLNAKRLALLHTRAQILRDTRAFFEARDFLEVETSLRVPAPGLELHLDPVAADGGFLITSPEFQMKRLLVAGMTRIFQICKCFRGNESGPHHASEFTMIEWYRAWDDWHAIARDTQELVCALAIKLHGAPTLPFDGRKFNVQTPWPQITVVDAFEKYAGIKLVGDDSGLSLRAKATALEIDCGTSDAYDDVFFAIFLAKIEPVLAQLDTPVLVTRWPAPLAALARRCPDDSQFCERFEAYIGGIELANAFGELTDAAEQRLRFADDLGQRAARGRAQFPLDERFLSALAEGMPPSAGIALGFDRLVMLLTGTSDIRDVQAFTPDEL
jgi:elongation factor P--(R)-beta-lysine ligase